MTVPCSARSERYRAVLAVGEDEAPGNRRRRRLTCGVEVPSREEDRLDRDETRAVC